MVTIQTEGVIASTDKAELYKFYHPRKGYVIKAWIPKKFISYLNYETIRIPKWIYDRLT